MEEKKKEWKKEMEEKREELKDLENEIVEIEYVEFSCSYGYRMVAFSGDLADYKQKDHSILFATFLHKYGII